MSCSCSAEGSVDAIVHICDIGECVDACRADGGILLPFGSDNRCDNLTFECDEGSQAGQQPPTE